MKQRVIDAAGMALTMLLVAAALVLVPGCTPTEATPILARHVDPIEQTAMDGAPRVALKYREMMCAAGRRAFGLNDRCPVLSAQTHQESGWNCAANSPVGAQGCSQFMPSTAAWLVKKYPDLGPVAPYDPAWAFRAQAKYMRDLYDNISYPKDCDHYGAALSSYNGGIGWHNRRRGAADNPNDFWNSVRSINPGITAGNQRENEAYPQIIVYQRQPLYKAWGSVVCNV